MKTFLIILTMLFTSALKAQSVEAQQLLLNFEKLTQLKNILNDMKKGYEIVSQGYAAIKNISEGNFNLHDVFMKGLVAVSPAVRNYQRIPDIIKQQRDLVNEYKNAFQRFKQSGMLSKGELEYLESVYRNLFNSSVHNLDELITVITASELSMSDDERLKAIDRIFLDVEEKLQFLRSFNRNANILVIQRAKERENIAELEKLYPVN